MGTDPAKSKSKPKKLVEEIAAGLGGMAIVIGVLLLIDRYLWGSCSFWIGAVLFPLLSFLMIHYTFNSKEMVADLEKDLAKGEAGDFYLFGLPVLQFISFVLLARGIYCLYGPEYYAPMPEPHLGSWFLYGLDNVLGTVLLDATEAYDWHVSPIRHAKTFWMSTLIFSYRAALSVGLIHIVMTAYDVIQKKRAEKAAAEAG